MNHTYQFYTAMLAFIERRLFCSIHAQKCFESYRLATEGVTFPEFTFKDLVEWHRQLYECEDGVGNNSSDYVQGRARREDFAVYAFTDLAPFFREEEGLFALFARIKTAADLQRTVFIYQHTPFSNSCCRFEMSTIITDNPSMCGMFFNNPERHLDGFIRVRFCGPSFEVRKKY